MTGPIRLVGKALGEGQEPAASGDEPGGDGYSQLSTEARGHFPNNLSGPAPLTKVKVSLTVTSHIVGLSRVLKWSQCHKSAA